jgi:hypothetical protein
VTAREGLYGKMDAFMPLEIMVSVETLWTLITFEWTIILLRRLTVGMAGIHAVMATIATHHAANSANHLHLRARVVDIGHDGSGHCWQRIIERAGAIMMLRCWRRL